MNSDAMTNTVRASLPMLAQLRRWLSRVWNWVPITPVGLVCLASMWISLQAFSGEHPDLIVCTLFALGVVSFALFLMLVIAESLWLRFRRQPAPNENGLELEVGQTLPSLYSCGLLSSFPLLHIEIAWRGLPRVHVQLEPTLLGLAEQVTPVERGRTERVVREFQVCDALGFFRIRFTRSQKLHVHCLPRAQSLASFPLIQQFRPGDAMGHPEGEPVGDMVEMRRYSMGDPLKLVLWKVYARTGRMLVRMPERSVSPTERMLVYFIPAEGDEPAAGLMRTAVESAALGSEAIYMSEGAVGPAKSPSEAVEQIVQSVRHRARGGQDLERFLTKGESLGTSAAFLFVPATPGPWVDRVLAVIASHRGPFQIVLGFDSIPSFASSQSESKATTEVPSLQRRLEDAGAKVTPIDVQEKVR